MATRSLSPKRAAERMQRFQHAVRVIALVRAKKAVQAQIRARGQRISDYSCREMSVMAEAVFERNREELITKAVAVCLTFREFAGFANLENNAQSQSPLKSTTSAVQMSGAE